VQRGMESERGMVSDHWVPEALLGEPLALIYLAAPLRWEGCALNLSNFQVRSPRSVREIAQCTQSVQTAWIDQAQMRVLSQQPVQAPLQVLTLQLP